jgi:hypothetical protein
MKAGGVETSKSGAVDASTTRIQHAQIVNNNYQYNYFNKIC